MNNSATRPRRPATRIALVLYLTLGGTATAVAQPFVSTRYVGIDHAGHTAYLYDEQFQRLPDSPYVAGTSMETLPEGKPLWLLGAKVDVVKRAADGSIDVVSDDPAYYEMNHHFTWIYHSDLRPVTDPCGINQPLAAGSELTDFRLPAGYGYKLDGGFWHGGAWHWANPAGVPHHEAVYLRFSLLLDDQDSGYRDVNVTWVDAEPCDSEFTVPPGRSTKHGAPVPVDRNARIVAVVPHVHDHARHLSLRRNGKKLRKFKPMPARIGTAHDDVGGGAVPLHTHKGHLPTEGLTPWTPGVHGPVVRAGDRLSAHGRFRNPHDRPIDNMALFIVFWEALADPAAKAPNNPGGEYDSNACVNCEEDANEHQTTAD